MSPFYPIRGVLAYYSPQMAGEKGIVWPEAPHVHFANVNLGWESLLAFDHKYGALLNEHWRMTPELKHILEKTPNLTREEREQWAKESKRSEITIFETDVDVAKAMQQLLRQAWSGEEVAAELIEYGQTHHAQQEAFGSPRLTISASKQGVVVYAKDLWSFIRVAFLLDRKRDRTKVCKNPDCPAPFFLAKRRDQRICERGDCTAWAQRQYALRWWETKGYEARRKHKKSSLRRAKRRPRT